MIKTESLDFNSTLNFNSIATNHNYTRVITLLRNTAHSKKQRLTKEKINFFFLMSKLNNLLTMLTELGHGQWAKVILKKSVQFSSFSYVQSLYYLSFHSPCRMQNRYEISCSSSPFYSAFCSSFQFPAFLLFNA